MITKKNQPINNIYFNY